MRRLALLLVLALLLPLAGCSVGSHPLQISAVFSTSAGLFKGNDVGILGVPVGKVTAIRPAGDHVVVDMEIDSDHPVPASAGAVVVSRSLATDRYVELTPVYARGPRMADGAVIPESRTRTPVEWDQILASLDHFDRGLLGPDGHGRAIHDLLAAGADALRGNGHRIHGTVSSLSQMMRVLAGHRHDLTGTIRSLDGLTGALAANDGTIRHFVDSVAGATHLMATERQEFGQTMTALSTLLRVLARFAREHQTRLRDGVTGLTTVTRTLLRHQHQLAETVENLPMLSQNLGAAIDRDGRLRVKLPANDLAPQNQWLDSLCAQLPAHVCDQLGTSPDLQQLLDDLVGKR